jgi:HK97 gp10 family phage protein
MLEFRATVTPGLFRTIEAALTARFENAIREVAEVGQKSAKALVSGPSPSAPGNPPGIITGWLRDSITIAQQDRYHWILLAGAHYSLYLEFGTYKMAARPFMRPTAVTLRQIAPGIVKRAMGG